VAGGVIDPFVRPGIALVEKLGQVFAGLAGKEALTSLDVDVRGELAAYDVSVYKLAALKGYFTNIVSENVSYVNAPLLAEQRGIEVTLTTGDESKDYRNTTTLKGILADGTVVSVAGTLSGTKMTEKIIGLNGYDIEVPIAEHHVVMVYQDRPGIVAVYGKAFGEAEINIANMQIARAEQGGTALSVLTVDSPVPAEILASVASAISAEALIEIDITE
ncbi:MAG: phosphoglycerate dehydrogenase, partial [Microbacteriaceae bacterium]|nr:phosphoglycerate dehydrogenase [Microbacteriaceae bacterium]